jgi:transcriptional regulator with XRE-family HTH domain
VISPYVRRLRLASELRALRARAGLTHQQLAKKIGESRAQISRLENGHVVDQADIIKILDALNVDGEQWTKVVTIAREAGERGWWESNKAMGERQALYANLEAGAATIREFHMTFVPGLLQTPEYTRARIEAESQSGIASFNAEKVIEARMARQRMMRRPDGPTYEVILDEVAIRRWAAPREVVKAQLYHVCARVNGDPRTTVRVLPVDALIGGYSLPRSSFSIYTFRDPDDPTVVAIDTMTNDMLRTDPSDATRYSELFDRLREASLPAPRSLQFLIAEAKNQLSSRVVP